jgi:DNA-directed RNA polymerase specialized sigma24 family protein
MRSKSAPPCISPRRGKWNLDAVCGQASAREGGLDTLSEARETRRLIGRCFAGDVEAAKEFQALYGELIYGYPMRVYRVPAEEAGDFYVFAFERGRIFRRVRTYEGRAPFRAYLLGFVLDDLVLEWKRGVREIETVSIETLGELPDTAAGDRATDSEGEGLMDRTSLTQLLGDLSPSKSVVMKLLYVEDYEFQPAEVRYLAQVSGCEVPEVLDRIDRLRATVREREAGLKRMEDALDAVQAWVQLYERRVQRINDDLTALPPTSIAAERLREERTQLERKIQRRRQQRAKLLAQAQRRKVTAPYKDIATMLNTSIGNIGSQIARLRRELLTKVGGLGPNLDNGQPSFDQHVRS